MEGIAEGINQYTSYFKIAEARKKTNDWLLKHPEVQSIVLIACHIIRTAPMVAVMKCLPFSPLVNIGLCVGGSLLYTFAIEGNCSYLFTIPSLFGATSYLFCEQALYQLITGVALSSLQTFALSFARCVPLFIWVAYVLIDSVYNAYHPPCCRFK